MQWRNGIDEERGVVIVGAFAQPRGPFPVLVARPSASIVWLAASRVARSLRKGHVWLQLGEGDPSAIDRCQAQAPGPANRAT